MDEKKVVPFRKTRFTYNLTIDRYMDDKPFAEVTRTDTDEGARYYVKAFIKDWKEIPELEARMKQLEEDLNRHEDQLNTQKDLKQRIFPL